MTLEPGVRLGPYEIESALGAGGMGEVYRARDTRLDRIVAIKVLPKTLAADSQFRERFDREARAVSQLAHPHICVLHDVGHDRDVDYLVMEHLEGETLADRLASAGRRTSAARSVAATEGGAVSPASLTLHAIPVPEALTIAIQIADALDHAHRAGIVHRDLKPGNVMLTPSGAKLLDFGLAKAGVAIAAGGMTVTTLTGRQGQGGALTAQGTILGTVQYMAPEQLEGKEADPRSDIFAFGCVLYEMLTGTKAFEGKSYASLIASILDHEPPPISTVKPIAPPLLDHVIARCLAKNPEHRWATVHDLRFELRWIAEHATEAARAKRKRAVLGTREWVLAGVGLGVLAVTAAAAGWFLKPAPPPPARVLTRFPIALPRGQDLSRTGRHVVALSPDGSKLVYVANNQLYLRPMDQLEASPIRGTDGDAASPFFSPDGQWIGFWRKGQLKKIPVGGGGAVTLCQADIPYGASWTDDRILFGEGPLGIFEVPANGGAPKTIVRVDRKEAAHGPQLLPGGDAVLFTLRPEGRTTWDEARAVVQSLKSGERKVLIERATDVRYVNTGHLVYVHAATLFAVPFDVARLAIAGGPVAVTEGVWEPGWIGTAQFAVSSAGTLAYVPGVASIKGTLVWVDRNGVEEPIPAPPHAYAVPRLSPDGSRVVLELNEQENDQWIWDFTRGTLTRLTFGPATDWQGTWTPDGRRIIFSSDPGGHRSIYWRAADGTGSVELLAKGPEAQFGYPSPDGRLLVAAGTRSAKTKRDLSLVHLDGDRRVEPLLESEFNEVNPAVSPNGRWLAYQSDESGQWEVYVRPFPDVDKGRWQISVNWGANPFWGHDGRELFYLDTDNVLVTPVQSDGPTFVAAKPAPLFSRRKYSSGFHFALSRDGRRFLAVKPDQPAQTQLLVVQHWFDELKARVPGK